MATLASFREPPVTEVVLAVRFSELSALTAARIGELWSTTFREEFPRTEDHPPYEPPFERFDQPSTGPQLLFGLGAAPPPRVWFLSESGDELLQVQRNWFACNWRRVKPDDEYDRWEPRRQRFLDAFRFFESFVQKEDLGKVEPLMCEVTYVNHILPNAAWNSLGEEYNVLKLLNRPEGEFLTQQENLQLSTQFAMRNAVGSPIGRLHVSLSPAFRREDGGPMLVLTLTARSLPAPASVEGVMETLDQGREWIVNSFASITTDEAQAAWGRYE